MTLRFCMVTTFYPPYHFGGDGIFVHTLANALARRGHAVTVLHDRDAYRALGGQPPAEAWANHPGVTVRGVETAVPRLAALAAHQAGRALLGGRGLRRALAGPWDVIHYHNVSLIGGPDILRHGVGIKLYTPHEYWLVCPTHVLFKYGRAACVQPRCLSCGLSQGRPPQLWRHTGLLRDALRHVDLFLFGSRFSADKHREMGLDLPWALLPPLAAAPPGPEDREAAPEPGGRRPYYLFAGRLERLKGVQDIIPFFRDYPHARLLIAGDGGYEPALRRLAGASPNIVFLGRLSRAALHPLYRGALGVVVPSQCYEAGPLVVIEAFQNGAPVVARRIGGLAEMIEGSDGGLLFEDGASLGAAIEALRADPALRARLAAGGRAAYLRDHAPETHVARYLALIEDLRARRPGSPPGPR